MKRRWPIFVIILVVVAVVLAVVFLTLFKDRDTRALARSTHGAVVEGYLDTNSEANQQMKGYLLNLSANDFEYQQEVVIYFNTLSAFEVLGDFFDRQIIYSSYTDTYKNNHKWIEKSFTNAQKAADALKDYIVENKSLVGDVEYWQESTWTDCRCYFRDLFDNTESAMRGLGQVYQASVNSKFMKNDLTKLLFEANEDYLTEIRAELDKVDEEIIVTSSENIVAFVEFYFAEVNENRILNYVYNTDAQQIVELINKNGKKNEDGNYTAEYLKLLDGSIVGGSL